MTKLGGWLGRLGSVVRRSREDAELDEEIRFHLEMEAEANRRAGMAAEEARRRAYLAFGGVERVKEEVREVRGLGWLEGLWRELRLALRGFRRAPGFTAAVVGTLALGIGAATAMFGVVDALLLRPLPYSRADQLVVIERTATDGPPLRSMLWEEGELWAQQTHLFRGVLPVAGSSALYTGDSGARWLSAAAAGANLHEILGVLPAIGRGFEAADIGSGAGRVVLLTDRFWRTEFGADRSVLGRTMQIRGNPHEIIGVLPPGFRLTGDYPLEVILPIRTEVEEDGWVPGRVSLIARTVDAPLASLQAGAQAAYTNFPIEHPSLASRWQRLELRPLQDLRFQLPEARRAIWLLSAAILLLVLASAASVAGLLVSRGLSKSQEFAVRAAMGASRGRLAFQVLLEALLLALFAAATALLIAAALIRTIRAIVPNELTLGAPYDLTFTLRATVFAFATASALGLLTGLIPVMRVAWRAPWRGGALTPYAGEALRSGWIRQLIVAGQVALSIVLLVGAGLLARSFGSLMAVDPGYRVEDVAVVSLLMPDESLPSDTARTIAAATIQDALRAVPGVERVALNARVPPSVGFMTATLETADGGGIADDPEFVYSLVVTPDYLDVLGPRLTLGRSLAAEDEGSDNVLVTEALANRLWSAGSPVGRQFRTSPTGSWKTVVGVVGDMKLMGPIQREWLPDDAAILIPASLSNVASQVLFAVRTQGDPRLVLPSMRAAVHAADPRVTITEVQTGGELYELFVETPRFLRMVMGVLSALALLLAISAIYALLSYEVVRRRREIGIRAAVGGSPARISATLLRRGMLPALTGAVLGLVGAVAGAAAFRALLHGIEPTDPVTLALVLAVSLASAAAACLVPAYRAATTSPAEVLKAE